MLSLKNINLLELEDLRDKKEIKLYFKTKNIELKNEDIKKLRNLFIVENNKYSLTMQQLEKIAGGESSELLIRKRAFSLLRGTKGIFAVNPAPVGKILLKNPEVDAVPASKGLQRVDVGTEPKIEVPTSESPKIEVVESHHGNIGSSTTGKQVHAVDLPKREQLQVEQHGRLEFYEHSIFGIGSGKKIGVENSHLRALFDEKSRHIGAVKELVAREISELKQAQKDLETVSSPQENAVARMILMREKERIQGEITHFKSIESGEIQLTCEEMNHVFNRYYGKEGLAESIISAMCPDQSWYNRVSFKNFDTDKKIIHCMDEHGRQHLVDLGKHLVIEGHKLNPVIIEAMQGLKKHDTYRIGDTDITHIGNLTDEKDRGKVTRSLFRANLPDGSKQVFDSNGNSLLKVNELERVESMEPGFYRIIAKMMDVKGSDTFTFAGATFRREVTRFDLEGKKKPFVEVFSCEDDLDRTVVVNSSGKILFKAKGGEVVERNRAGCGYIAKQLEDKETVIIAGVEFTRIDNNVFKYIVGLDGTVVFNSTGKILFKAEGGKVDELIDPNFCKCIANQLQDVDINGKKEYLGVTFTKIADDVFSYVNWYDETEVVNSTGEILFKAKGGKVVEMNEAGCGYIAKLLKDKKTGESVTIAGATFIKTADREFRYVDVHGWTVKIDLKNYSSVVVNSAGKTLFKAKGGKVVEMYKTGDEYIAKLLKDKKTGESVTIAGATFTKTADREFIYKTNDGFTVKVNQKYATTEVYNSSDARLFSAIRDSVWEMDQTGCKYVAKQLKGKNKGDTVTIAGVKFTKVGMKHFMYEDCDGFTRIIDANGKTCFKAKDGKVISMNNYIWKNCIYPLLLDNQRDSSIRIFGAVFKKVISAVYTYEKCECGTAKAESKESTIVVRGWQDSHLFTVRGGKIVKMTDVGREFIADRLEDKRLGEEEIIAGVKFTKVGMKHFMYEDCDGFTRIIDAKGKTYFEAKDGKVISMNNNIWKNCIYPLLLDNQRDSSIRIFGVVFKKVISAVYTYEKCECGTAKAESKEPTIVVRGWQDSHLFTVRGGKIVKMTDVGREYIADRLKDKRLGEEEIIAGVPFTKTEKGFKYNSLRGLKEKIISSEVLHSSE